MPRAVFLDRDNTLVRDAGFVHRVEDLELLPGVPEGLARLRDAGFLLFIVTNQSGIGRGLYTTEQFLAFQEALYERLREHGVEIEGTYFCPHTPEDDCDCRKPRPRHLEEARRVYGLDLGTCWVVGDRASDVELAHNVAAHAAFLRGTEPSDPANPAEVTATGFAELVEAILAREADR
jgi:D-glycero-D-manno-heptose 1,7-bisphosphate phosphatase